MASKGKEVCLGCGKSLAKAHCHQCTVCGLWIHKACSGISDEFFRYLEEQVKATGMAYWACRPCTAYAQGINNRMKNIEDRVGNLETVTKDGQAGLTAVERRVVELENQLKTVTEQLATVSKSTSDSVFQEIRERSSRVMNLTVHNVPELAAEGATGKDKQAWDTQSCVNLFAAIGLNLTAESIKFCRRVGPVREGPRTIVLGMHREADRQLVLSNAKYLARTDFSTVGIVPDLTKRQRQEEKDLGAEADVLNAARSAEEIQKNLKWAVVGVRGAKKLLLLPERSDHQQPARGRGRGRGRPPLRGRVPPPRLQWQAPRPPLPPPPPTREPDPG